MDGIWAFVALAVVLTLSPGPDDVLVLRSALRGGARLGLATVGGIAVGSLAWGAAATLGLAAVVTASPPLHDALRIAGACYLVALGLAPTLAGRLRRVRHRVPVPAAGSPRSAAGSRRGAFLSGLAGDVLNPKIGLFYVSVVPQFVPGGAPAFSYALLCAIDVAIATVWLSGVAWSAHAAVRWLLQPAVALWSQRISSATLIGLGATAVVGL